MNSAIQQRKEEKVIKAIKGLYRGLERIDDSAGYRANVRLCLERARLVTESYKETDGQPMVIRRAKALKKILENMTIFIQDNEQINVFHRVQEEQEERTGGDEFRGFGYPQSAYCPFLYTGSDCQDDSEEYGIDNEYNGE